MKKTKRLPVWGNVPPHLRPNMRQLLISLFGWGRQSAAFNVSLTEIARSVDRRDANWMYCRMRRRARQRPPEATVIE